jgi:hypothetical protein
MEEDMAKKAPQAFGYRELDEALRTAVEYVEAVRSAFAAQEAGVKKTELKELVEGPVFVRRACGFRTDGPQIVRKACALPLGAAGSARRTSRKAARRV